jgi:hypothetical protein
MMLTINHLAATIKSRELMHGHYDDRQPIQDCRQKAVWRQIKTGYFVWLMG